MSDNNLCDDNEDALISTAMRLLIHYAGDVH